MGKLIELQNIEVRYPQETRSALHDANFFVNEGEFVCLIGSSGCGKSTALKLIAGLIKPTSGTVVKPDRVAMSFQQGALFPWLTVYENVALGLRQTQTPPDLLHRIVERELRAMRIRDFAQKYPSDLSGGQRQRVGIARALAVDPHVLLLDEPFSALDPQTTAQLHDDLIDVWRRTKKTIVLVSHLIEEAVSLADRVILMKDGTVASEYRIDLPYPRRENDGFHKDVMKIRKDFFR
jgi:NitT/TauT family transport system ATP-binding protein